MRCRDRVLGTLSSGVGQAPSSTDLEELGLMAISELNKHEWGSREYESSCSSSSSGSGDDDGGEGVDVGGAYDDSVRGLSKAHQQVRRQQRRQQRRRHEMKKRERQRRERLVLEAIRF